MIWPGAQVSIDAIEDPVTASSEASDIIVPSELAPPQTRDGTPAPADAPLSANVGASGAPQAPNVVARTPGQNSLWRTAAQKTAPVYGPFGGASGQAPPLGVSRSNPGTWLFTPNSNGN
jgi:hypothetical protein